MIETEAVSPNVPFHQGDIIRLEIDERVADPAFGLIINADCDLMHCKIDGVVSYLPVYSFSYYFERFWIPSYVSSRRLEILTSISQVCGLREDKHNSLVTWIRPPAHAS